MLVLGAIGIFLPMLPTTPFVLVAAACFSQSPRLSAWLLKSKFFGEYIRNYRERQGLKKSTVITSLTFLWTMLGLSAFLSKSPILAAGLAVVGAAVTAHILHMSKDRRDPPREDDP